MLATGRTEGEDLDKSPRQSAAIRRTPERRLIWAGIRVKIG